MVKTWTASDDDPEALARQVEGHLNEYAEVILSVSYSVSAGRHYVMAVYRPVDPFEDLNLETAVTAAEDMIEEAQTS